MQLHTLKPLERADMQLTLLQRLNDVFHNAHPQWSLTWDDIREILLLYLSLTSGERWCLSKIVSMAGRKPGTGTTGIAPLTAHLHSGPHTPCPQKENVQ